VLVLVTGGTGAVGSEVVKRLRAAGHRARVLSRKPGEGEDWVQGDIATLYTEVTRGDAAPTVAQLSATDTARRALTGLLSSCRQLQADLPALNTRLRAARLAPIRADLPPPRDLNVADAD